MLGTFRVFLTAALMLAGCGGGSSRTTTTLPAPAATATRPPAAARPPDGALAGDASYRVELAALPPCTAGTACEVQLVVRALADYHVNVEFPSKFVAAADALPVDGTGTFTIPEPARGVMTLRFTPKAAGTARVEGTLKFAVCTELVCEPRAVQIAFDVPVT